MCLAFTLSPPQAPVADPAVSDIFTALTPPAASDTDTLHVASGPPCPAPASDLHLLLHSQVPSTLVTFLFPVPPRSSVFSQGLGPTVFLKPGHLVPQISMASSFTSQLNRPLLGEPSLPTHPLPSLAIPSHPAFFTL